MRIIRDKKITESVSKMVKEANYNLNDDMIKALKKGKKEEESIIAKDIFTQIIKNAEIAAEERVAICQDTGFVVVFLEIGEDLKIKGNIYEAVNEGVRLGYKEGFLRNSIVNDPILRKNTNDNTPAVIYTEITVGDKLKITVAPKGGGSENMSQIKMLKPSDGVKGIKNFVLDVVEEAGANPCPPIIVGVGLGGTFEKAAYLAKKSLFRPINDSHSELHIAKLENELLEDINKLGIGPQGFGGRKTALAVKIEKYPCHIASLPVAVNLNCHAARHKTSII